MTDQPTNTPVTGITPEVGKRYVTRGGWVTPQIVRSESNPQQLTIANETIVYKHDDMWRVNGGDDPFEIISEYVEPTAPTDTFRRDLVVALYVGMVTDDPSFVSASVSRLKQIADWAQYAADTLIEAMEEKA